jgi:hypothetical protein
VIGKPVASSNYDRMIHARSGPNGDPSVSHRRNRSSYRQAARRALNATAVQNPLTTLLEAVVSVQRVLAPQDGPTVLVGHSFSGMIVTEAGVHPKVSALVYPVARHVDSRQPVHDLVSDLFILGGGQSTATKSSSQF